MNVASFYRFLDLCNPAGLRDSLLLECRNSSLLGTVLIASEGINGTLAGAGEDIAAVLDWITTELGLDEPLDARWTDTAEAPFRHLRVRVKKEIVTLGRPDLQPHKGSGTYVDPQRWNQLLDDPDVLVIDTRNHYEHEVGTFPRAINPATDSFREFPAFAESIAAVSKDRPLAMFCTGGIRCEKATALMLELGFKEVYHLQGGILNYLKETPPDENRWTGECFIFDTRVALDKDLGEGGYVQCHACRRPLSAEDLQSADYREGVSCPQCISELEEERARRLEERRKQVALARERGKKHIGPQS